MRRRLWVTPVALLGALSLLLLAVPSTQAQSSVNENDRAALKALYEATDGDNWTTRTGWGAIDTTTDLGTLHGVTVDTGSRRVTSVNLRRNQLSGTIPDLSALTSLQRLRLDNNQLSGTIPDLSALTNLQRLFLHKNQLSGTIPDLSALTKLQELYLYTNQLRGPIPDLSSLTSLTHLNLDDTQLGLATNGQRIATPLDGLAAKLPAATLAHLSLDKNQLSGPIPDLSSLTSLISLHLSDNDLDGPIPTKLTDQTDPNSPRVPALPAGLSNLHLDRNQLSGEIPDLSSLTSLQNIYLGTNQLSGEIPTKLTDPTDPDSPRVLALPAGLGYLYLDHNQLSGEIPTDLISQTNLRVLYLDHNQLSGEIPDLSALTLLLHLGLDHNQLNGPIPNLSALTKLQNLRLHANQLGLDTDGQQITAPLDGLAAKLPAATLQRLQLNHNQLNGPIPDLSSLTALRELELQDNALTGAIPTTLPTKLHRLYLHNNDLVGPIPASLARDTLTELEYLSLYGNPDLYGYPATMADDASLILIAPGDGTAICLYGDADGEAGTTDCTVPTLVDKLHIRSHSTGFTATWEPQPADPAPSGYTAWYRAGRWASASVTGTMATVSGPTPGAIIAFLVRTTDHPTSPRLYYEGTLPERTATPPRPPTTGGRGGGGGGARRAPDQHGDTLDEATSLNPRRYTTGYLRRRLDARLQSFTDVDTFAIEIPHAGVLLAHTTGPDTTGRLYQAQTDGAPALVAADTASGPFRLGVAVEPGTYYLSVSAGTSFGDYRLGVDYTPAFVDNPAPNAPQSGLGVLSGWVCATATVEMELVPENGEPHLVVPATGTARADTAGVCGAETTDTGFGLLFNWNLLGDGAHTVRVRIADVVFAERQITVTTLGDHAEQEYRRGLHATTTIPDFPDVGETTTLRWAEALQNFVIASGDGGDGGEQLTPEQARLENPAPGSFQSGLGVISGWVCEADTVEIVFEPGDTDESLTFEAGSGTERLDTADRCGDTDNGFGLLFNWNLLGDGTHTVRAVADGDEFAHSTVTVTTLDGEFARGLRQTHTIADFPAAGQTTTVEWQEAQQNFVVTGVE